MNWTDLQAFLHVAQTGSVTGAATALDVPRSTISRRVARLEEDLEVSLLARTGRSVELTQQGRVVHERCGQALSDIEDVRRVLTDQAAEPRGTLKLTATPGMSRSPEFARLLAAYRAQCPQVSVDILLTARSVDLVEEGFDVAVRPGPPAGVGRDGLMQRKLSSNALRLYASPEYLRRNGSPVSLDELADHEFIAHGIVTAADRLAAHAPAWRAIAEIDLAVVVNDFDLVAELLVAGAGIGIAPDFVGERHAAQGRLERILPDASFGGSVLWLLWPQSRFTSVRVRRFIDLAAEVFA